ncbi:MAG: hypothetical protein LUF30_13325 [Lachnospiraceae bacterium]|nr:hypothetical protein [Lachnospiraceae bacterium]
MSNSKVDKNSIRHDRAGMVLPVDSRGAMSQADAFSQSGKQELKWIKHGQPCLQGYLAVPVKQV